MKIIEKITERLAKSFENDTDAKVRRFKKRCRALERIMIKFMVFGTLCFITGVFFAAFILENYPPQ